MPNAEQYQWLCQAAGLPSEVAARMAAEGLNLKLLHAAKLSERRDAFRGMGLLYGQIMAINRALEGWVPEEVRLAHPPGRPPIVALDCVHRGQTSSPCAAGLGQRRRGGGEGGGGRERGQRVRR